MKEIRREYLQYLRENPKGFGKCELSLKDGNNRCAVGMGYEFLGINPEEANGNYDQFRDALELTVEETDRVWKLNDRELFLEEDGNLVRRTRTFTEIADELEREWDNG